MWEWRDDTERGGWRLDAHGSWIWDDPSPLERVGAGTEALRAATASSRGPRPDAGLEPTPIFHSMAVDRRRWVSVPEPHPGSGPLPVMAPDGPPAAAGGRTTSGRELGPAPAAPAAPLGTSEGPGSGAGDSTVRTAPAESPEEEMRRRAERRRRPWSAETSAGAGGRHAMAPREEPERGRHAMRR